MPHKDYDTIFGRTQTSHAVDKHPEMKQKTEPAPPPACASCGQLVKGEALTHSALCCGKGHKFLLCSGPCQRVFEKRCSKVHDALLKVQQKIKNSVGTPTLRLLPTPDREKLMQLKEADRSDCLICPEECKGCSGSFRHCSFVLLPAGGDDCEAQAGAGCRPIPEEGTKRNKAQEYLESLPDYEDCTVLADDMLVALPCQREEEEIDPAQKKKQSKSAKKAQPKVSGNKKAQPNDNVEIHATTAASTSDQMKEEVCISCEDAKFSSETAENQQLSPSMTAEEKSPVIPEMTPLQLDAPTWDSASEMLGCSELKGPGSVSTEASPGAEGWSPRSTGSTATSTSTATASTCRQDPPKLNEPKNSERPRASSIPVQVPAAAESRKSAKESKDLNEWDWQLSPSVCMFGLLGRCTRADCTFRHPVKGEWWVEPAAQCLLQMMTLLSTIVKKEGSTEEEVAAGISKACVDKAYQRLVNRTLGLFGLTTVEELMVFLPSVVKNRVRDVWYPRHGRVDDMKSIRRWVTNVEEVIPEPPVMALEGEEVHVVDSVPSAQRFEDAVEEFLSVGGEVGLDIEWGNRHPVSLVQLALAPTGGGPVRVFLLDLHAPIVGALRTAVTALLLPESPYVTVLVFSPDDDLRRLQKELLPSTAQVHFVNTPQPDLEGTQWIDLQMMAAGLDGRSRPSLAYVIRKSLGSILNKQQQCSAWDQRPLSPEQITYAALDAVALLRLWRVLGTSEQALPLERRLPHLVERSLGAQNEAMKRRPAESRWVQKTTQPSAQPASDEIGYNFFQQLESDPTPGEALKAANAETQHEKRFAKLPMDYLSVRSWEPIAGVEGCIPVDHGDRVHVTWTDGTKAGWAYGAVKGGDGKEGYFPQSLLVLPKRAPCILANGQTCRVVEFFEAPFGCGGYLKAEPGDTIEVLHQEEASNTWIYARLLAEGRRSAEALYGWIPEAVIQVLSLPVSL